MGEGVKLCACVRACRTADSGDKILQHTVRGWTGVGGEMDYTAGPRCT